MELHTSDFDFELPAELIASHPLHDRDASRMLVVSDSGVSDKHIRDFLDFIRAGDVVVFNNSRVIPARFNADGHEITLHTAASENHRVWWGLCKKFNKLHIGDVLTLDDGQTQIKIIDSDADSGLKIEFLCDDVFAVLDQVGKMPLPPYMKRDEETEDRERYQTVYSEPLGSMAAPTAGLHFTPELMAEIENRGAKIVKVTLHVGAGTWMPVKTEDLSQHKMHSEWCCITPQQAEIINNASRVIAVGTTSMRTLESAAQLALQQGVARKLPANPELKERAKELRKAGSLPEALLWKEISGKKINGLNFDRQKVIGNYIVDFFCPHCNVVIEIDDEATHANKGAYDAKREHYLQSLGLTIVHFSASEILKNINPVVDWLKRHPALQAPLCQRGTGSAIVTQQSSPLLRGVARSDGVSYPRVAPICATTDIFITPGYKFRAVDVLLTNFHLPKSTLFMLVSAFAGLPEMKNAYSHAVAEKYRFFSYGDCCLLFKK